MPPAAEYQQQSWPAGVARKLCRHCETRPVQRPRGLCWGCYYAPGVRDLYPPTSKYARCGVAGGQRGRFADLPPPPDSTPHRPGSEGKIAALEARAAAGVGLWHPGDG